MLHLTVSKAVSEMALSPQALGGETESVYGTGEQVGSWPGIGSLRRDNKLGTLL